MGEPANRGAEIFSNIQRKKVVALILHWEYHLIEKAVCVVGRMTGSIYI
jgi:hypothetical protein